MSKYEGDVTVIVGDDILSVVEKTYNVRTAVT